MVRGFCDFDSRLLRGDASPLVSPLALCELGRDLLGEQVQGGLPAGPAAALVYRLLSKHLIWYTTKTICFHICIL